MTSRSTTKRSRSKGRTKKVEGGHRRVLLRRKIRHEGIVWNGRRSSFELYQSWKINFILECENDDGLSKGRAPCVFCCYTLLTWFFLEGGGCRKVTLNQNGRHDERRGGLELTTRVSLS